MRYLLLILLLAAAPATLRAATVRFVQGKASAPVNTVLRDGQTFATGDRSKSHVALPNGFFRVGSGTGVQVVTSNNVSLEKGIMLAGSDPARFRRTAVNVSAPGYKLELKGTAQFAYYPGHYFKITVLEGRVRVALQSLTGEWETLEPGQMLIINPADKRLPEPVVVDIGRLAATSQLIGGAFAELSTQGLINAAAAAQGGGLLNGDLTTTQLRLLGASPDASLALSNRQPPKTAGVLPQELAVFNVANDLANPNAVARKADYASDVAFTSYPYDVNGDGIIENIINRDVGETKSRATEWIVHLTSKDGPALLSDDITDDPAMFAGNGKLLTFVSSNGAVDVQNANVHTTPNVGLKVSGIGVTMENSTLRAGDGKLTDEVVTLASTGKGVKSDISITSNSTLTGGKIDVYTTGTGTSVTINQSILTGPLGVTVGNSMTNAVINIQNSSQLLALQGSLSLLTKGGSITVADSKLQAAKILTLDTLNAGAVEVSNATLSASTIRIRGYGVAGTNGVIIDGSTLVAGNATQLIHLFAEGGSTLYFRHQVNLNAKDVQISGQTVEVEAGGTVTITGKGTVYTDHALFNSTLSNAANKGSLHANGGLTIDMYKYPTKPNF